MSTQKFDRSAFKATKVVDIKEQSDHVDSITKLGDRAEILSLKKDGSKNRLRIFPKHPGTKYYSYPLHKHILKVQSTDKDNNPINDANGNPEIKGRAIFSAKVHGGSDKCIIDEYIQRVYKRAYDEIQDETTRKKFLSHITGFKGSDNKWKPGITAMKSWIVYGDLNGKFGRIELPTSVKDKLNEVAAQQDMDADPFSDPDTGRVVFITFDANENDPKKKYSVSIDLAGPTVMTDEQMDLLSAQKPLQDIYEGTYRRRDFFRAMEGLKRFDEESVEKLQKAGFTGGYEIFSFDDFLDVAEQLSELYPDGDSEESDDDVQEDNSSNDVPFKADQVKPINQTTTSPELNINQPIDSMNLEELKLYISTHKLQIRVLPSYTEPMIRQFIKEEGQLNQNTSTNEQPVETKPSEEVSENKTESRADRIARLNNIAK